MLARCWRRLGVSLLALASWLALAGGQARGQDAQPTYETRRVQLFLDSERLVEDPQPEGKTVAYVRCVRRHVLEADDPIVLAGFAPTWPNYFHWRSDEVTVRREVLLRAGTPYLGSRAEETTRNLRDLGIFSLVRVVAVQVRDPRQVGVIVYTRDLWSLRLEQQFAGAGSTFSLGLQLVERNFLGRGKSLAANFVLEPLRYVVGQSYLDPRVSGGELRLYEALSLFINRGSGVLEGSSGTLLFGRPFYNLAQRVSFDLLGQYADYVSRDAPNGHVAGFDASPGPRHGTECRPGAPQCLPRVWDARTVKLEAAVYLRTGERYTQTWSAGAGFQDRAVAANAETGLAPTQRAVFEREVLPRVRRSAYPFARYRLDLPTYVVFTNLGTFGQSEPVQTGPRLDARFELPLTAFGSSNDGFVTRGSLGYVWARHDALLDVVTSAGARLDAARLVDEHGLLRVRGASPTLPWVRGRLVFRGIWDERRRDTQRTLVALGGDTGLRGYGSGTFYDFGASYLLANVEYRTPPLALQSVQLGLAAFYDAGAVYRDFSQARGHHAVGLGLRVLLPQFNRYVFRVDCGTPLDSPGFGLVLNMLSYGTEQLIALTPGEDALAPAPLDLN